MSQIKLPAETFVLLLEKLELSKGFLTLEKRTNKPHISKTSLLPSQEVIDMIEDARNGNMDHVLNFIQQKQSIISENPSIMTS